MSNVLCNVNIVYALQMERMAISLLRTCDGFPRTNFDWTPLHTVNDLRGPHTYLVRPRH